MGRSQRGNNNAYCQDNEITWFDWSDQDSDLLEFTKRLVALRRSHPVFRRRRYLAGAEAAEVGWFTPAGEAMEASDWATKGSLALAIYLDGSDDPDRSDDGTLLVDDDFLVLVNAWWEPLGFTVPPTRAGLTWQTYLDTYDPDRAAAELRPGDVLTVGPRSVVVLLGPRLDHTA
jgi:glycogen operon protein